MTNQSYNCTIRLVPLAYCTIDNICILSVTYKAHKRVVETRGVEPLQLVSRFLQRYSIEIIKHKFQFRTVDFSAFLKKSVTNVVINYKFLLIQTD